LRITPFKFVAENRYKNYTVADAILRICLEKITAVELIVPKISRGQRSEGSVHNKIEDYNSLTMHFRTIYCICRLWAEYKWLHFGEHRIGSDLSPYFFSEFLKIAK